MPQPIDMQTELARATMADRIQQATDRASVAAAMRARLEGEENQALGETQIDDTPDSQSEHIDSELKRRNPYAGRRKKRGDGKPDANRPAARPSGPAGHHFDVSV